MTRQVYGVNPVTGRVEHYYRDEGPQRCVPHVPQRTAILAGVPVRVPVRTRRTVRLGGDS